MDIKLDFDPKEVAEKMHEAIINGAFKDLFTKAVEAECKRLSESNGQTAKTWELQQILGIYGR